MDNLVDIQDENKGSIDKNKLVLDYSANKYSSTKSKIWHLSIDGKQIGRKDIFTFKYNCVSCGLINSVSTVQFLRRLNNRYSSRCYMCRNLDESKRMHHSQLMMNNKNALGINPKQFDEPLDIDPISIRDSTIKSFKEICDKDAYFVFHLTEEEYKRISKNIVAFQDGNLSFLENYEYWPIFKSSNQMMFTSVMYDKINKIIFKSHLPIMCCDNCGQNWRSKSIERFKNCYRILCKDCSCTNKIFKIRMAKNCCEDLIMYQSKLELKFIDWCNSNLLKVINGPKVKYNFTGKERTYRVDFQIGRTLIEIKDNHIWHKNDLQSGKWDAKFKAVESLIMNMEYDKFLLIQPTNWDHCLGIILKI